MRGDTVWDYLFLDAPWWVWLILIIIAIPLVIIALVMLPALLLAEWDASKNKRNDL